MASNAQRGARYKAKTRAWLKDQGFQVAEMEMVKWINPPGRDRIPVKRDQFGADLIAMSATELVFVQVKGGDQAHIGNFPDVRRKFAEFTFPPFAQRWVVAWPTRARAPRVVKLTDATPAAVIEQAVMALGLEGQ